MTTPPDPSQILVFKTDVNYDGDCQKIRPMLDGNTRIMHWHVDLQDVDKVLRVQANGLPAGHVIDLLQQAGYQCEELPD